MSAESKKRYVIAIRHQAVGHVKAGWQERLALVPGVSTVAATPRRIQVDATSDAIRRLADELGDEFLIEELLEREPDS